MAGSFKTTSFPTCPATTYINSCLVDYIAEGKMLSLSRSFWRRGDTSWLSYNFFRQQDVVRSIKWRLKENNNIPSPHGLAVESVEILVGMRKEQKEKEPVENEEKNMATATPQALMSKLLLQPVVGQDEFGKETEGDACRAASHRCGQQGEQHDCSDCRCWARKKRKGDGGGAWRAAGWAGTCEWVAVIKNKKEAFKAASTCSA